MTSEAGNYYDARRAELSKKYMQAPGDRLATSAREFTISH